MVVSARQPVLLLVCGLLFAAAAQVAVAQTADPAGFYTVGSIPGYETLRIPAFPNNILIFTGRDFVHVDAYTQYKGQDMTVEVQDTKGTVVGKAICQVSGDDVAFEINHPGAFCWGAGLPASDPLSKVTPAIENNFKVQLKINGDVVGEMVAADCGGLPETPVGSAPILPPSAQSSLTQPAPDTVVLTGYSKKGLDEAGAAVRIVAPALLDEAVGKRDIRVTTTGPTRPAGLVGTSALVFSDFPAGDSKAAGFRKWTGTFLFDGATASKMAGIAMGGIPSITFAAYTDAAANPVALTLMEPLEPGGAGTGLCPPGPAIAAPATGTFTTQPVKDASGAVDLTKLRVDWTEPAASAQQSPRVGFHVLAMSQTTGIQVEIGQYIPSSAAVTTTIVGLSTTDTYKVAVRSASADGRLSLPFDTAAPTSTTQTQSATASAKVVNGNQVVLTADPAGAPMYFTSDAAGGQAVTVYSDATGLASSAVLYDANKPLAIPAGGSLDISYVVFAGTNGFRFGGTFTTAAAAAVTGVPAISGSATQGGLSLTWTAAAGAVDYVVKVYQQAAAPTATDTPFATLNAITDKFKTVNGLTAGLPYYATVAGRNADATPGTFSTPTGKLVPTKATDTLTISQNQWKSGDWRITGTTTDPTAVIYACLAGPCGPRPCGGAAPQPACPAGVTLVPSFPVAPAAAVAPGLPTWTVRLTGTTTGTVDPKKIWLASSLGAELGGTAAQGLPTTAAQQKGRRLLQN